MDYLVVISYWVEAEDPDVPLDAVEDHVLDLKAPNTEATLAVYSQPDASRIRAELEADGGQT